jgi:hypothetical protein
MGSFTKIVGGIAGATLAATIIVAPSAANAHSTTGGHVITVPCNTTQLVSAVRQANLAGNTTIRLARNCTYLTNATLVFLGKNIRLIGGPSTVIKADPAQPAFGPILSATLSSSLRVEGIFIIGGSNPLGGGGIDTAGNLTLNFVTVTGNAAGFGGGVVNSGRLLILHSVIKANTATGFGGGILNIVGQLTVIESLVAGNHAGTNGGGIENDAVANIIQSTIDKNTASQGGGIFNDGVSGRTSLDRSLVQENKANPGLTNGGGIFRASGNVALRRSIVRLNAPTNCAPLGSIPGCLG